MTPPDFDRVRQRHFMQTLVEQNECVVHEEPIDLIDAAAILGTRDGDRLRALDELCRVARLGRLDDGRYQLTGG